MEAEELRDSWPMVNVSGNNLLYEHQSTISILNIDKERAINDAILQQQKYRETIAKLKAQNNIGFLDQEWKDRSVVSKAGYVLANIFTLGGIVWGRKITSCCCKNSLKSVDRQNQIEFNC